MAELMSMVALNECACRIDFQRQLDALKADEDRLGRELGTYLDHIEK